METYNFDVHNENAFTQKNQKNINFTYHCNDFDFPYFHNHEDYWEFTLVTSGSLFNIKESENSFVDTNYFFITPTNVVHKIVKNKNDKRKLSYINLIFRENKFTEICKALGNNILSKILSLPPVHLPQNIVDQCEETIHLLRSVKTNDFERYEELIQSMLLLIMQYLIAKCFNIEKKENSLISELTKISQDPQFPKYNVDDLCRVLGYSRMQLNRIIKEEYGITPHEYLKEYKLSYAYHLLVTTDIRVSVISEMLGYSTQSTFIKNFKEKFGKSPQQFKRGL